MSKSFKDAMLAADKAAIEHQIIQIAKKIEQEHQAQLKAVASVNEHRVHIIHELNEEVKELKDENKILKDEKKVMLEEINTMSAELSEIKAFNEALSHNDALSKKIIAKERAKFKELEKAYVKLTMEISKLHETLADHDLAATKRERVQRAIIAKLCVKK